MDLLNIPTAVSIIGVGMCVYFLISVVCKSKENKVWNDGVCKATGQPWSVIYDGEAYVICSASGTVTISERIKWLDLEDHLS